MTIEKFCQVVAKGHVNWITSGMDYRSWMNWYDLKSEAKMELSETHPEIRYIEDFWTWLRTFSFSEWAFVIKKEIKKIKHGHPCYDCEKTCHYPAIRCDKCAEIHKQVLKERNEAIKKFKNRRKK